MRSASEPCPVTSGEPPSRSRRRTPGRRRTRSRGRRRGSRAPRASAIAASVSGREYALWLVATITTSAPAIASSSAAVGLATTGSWTTTSASSRSSSRISLCDSESRSSSVSRLNARPSTATRRSRSVAEPALDAVDEEQRHGLVDARDGEQHARRVRALLGEREVLAQARPGGEPRHRHPAARIVAVDQLDHVEHVRAVALAVHHQQVGQRERGVAQDVGPDLRQLRLHRRRLHDRRAEAGEQLGRALARGLADPADDARQRADLGHEAVGRDPLRHVRDEHVLADAEAAVLLEVAGHELGRPGRDRRAQHERLARAQQRAADRRARRGCRPCRSRCARARGCRA